MNSLCNPRFLDPLRSSKAWRGWRVIVLVGKGILLGIATQIICLFTNIYASGFHNGIYTDPPLRFAVSDGFIESRCNIYFLVFGFFIFMFFCKRRLLVALKSSIGDEARLRKSIVISILTPILTISFTELIVLSSLSIYAYIQNLGLLRGYSEFFDPTSFAHDPIAVFACPAYHFILMGLLILWVAQPLIIRNSFPSVLHLTLVASALLLFTITSGLSDRLIIYIPPFVFFIMGVLMILAGMGITNELMLRTVNHDL